MSQEVLEVPPAGRAFSLRARLKTFLAIPTSRRVDGLLLLLSILIVAGGVYVANARSVAVQRGPILATVHVLWENLPLTLPVLSAFLSVMLNFRDILKPYGLLMRLQLPFSLGLVSFSIWYVVAAQTAQDDYIRIGPNKVLFKQYAIILVLAAFIWAGFCALARVMAEEVHDSQRGWAWHVRQAITLSISICALVLPFFLFEDKREVEKRIQQSLDEKLFTVSIPWKDPSLYAILGKRSDEIVFCSVVRQVPGKTAAEAIKKAREVFVHSPDARQRYGNPPPNEEVKVQEQMIVAEVDTGIRH